MLEVDSMLSLVLLGLWIFALFDVITTDAAEIRNLPKVAWLLLVLLLFGVGAIAWLLLGRPRRSRAFDPAGRGPSWATRPNRTGRLGRVDEEAELQARIEARDRMLAAWAEEERRKAQAPPAPDPDGGPVS